MITAFADLDTAIEALRGDVHDFFPAGQDKRIKVIYPARACKEINLSLPILNQRSAKKAGGRSL